MSTLQSNRSEQKPASIRKGYSKPRLHTYGDLTTITQSINGMGMADGGGGTGSDMNRTS